MNRSEALDAIDFWMKKGWRFRIDGESPGEWHCDVVGAGLAYASCGGKSFEEAVEIALSHATQMEDDPLVLLAKYSDVLKEHLTRIFGKEAFHGFDVVNDEWNFGPQKIEYVLWPDCRPTQMVDKEMEFMTALCAMPREIMIPLVPKIVWPVEAEKK